MNEIFLKFDLFVICFIYKEEKCKVEGIFVSLERLCIKIVLCGYIWNVFERDLSLVDLYNIS